ncbi:MAG: amidohydrolase family protein [Lentisphaerae bacterium]|nr:amidohydrolase family protein [Lentisphaerota bacterium]
MIACPVRTEVDEAFYRDHIRARLPRRIFDVHVHLNLPGHISMVPESRWLTDWALESGHLLSYEDAVTCAKTLYPDIEYEMAGFPWPIREADLAANNAYLARLSLEGQLSPFMVVRPEWSLDDIEKALLDGNFVGFKPYPDMFSGVKGADISIFDFIPPEQWRLLNHHRKAVLLHLPRKNRIADDDNIRELLDIRNSYPDVTIIIAHFGRAFCPVYLEQGLDRLGDVTGFYFDTAAVINPNVYDLAFSRIPIANILYGSDMPILLWHGRREWTQREYINLCREPFGWNQEHRSSKEEAGYTFFLYEQMRSILDAMDRNGLSDKDKQGVFGANAEIALKLRVS